MLLETLHLKLMGICKATDKPCIIHPYLKPVFIDSVFLNKFVEGADIILSGNEFHISTSLRLKNRHLQSLMHCCLSTFYCGLLGYLD